MKAAVYHRYGPPQVVAMEEIDTPVPKENEVLIRVHASTVNRTETGFRSAEYVISRFWSGLLKPKYKVLGCEFAGEIVSVGSNVNAYKPGDKVFGYNDQTFGGHAEYLVQHEAGNFTTLPNGFTYEEAAPLTEGSHYALENIRAAKVQPGHQVMVYGATGAIGSAAVQLLKYFGAIVTAVCNTERVELVRSLGADKVIDYTKEDYTNTDQRFDFVFDAVGKSSFGKCKPILKDHGVYISTELGKGGENIYLALLGAFTKGKRVLFPLPTISKADILLLKELAEQGKFKPVIDRKYSLEDIVEAHRYVESGVKTGNVVISIAS